MIAAVRTVGDYVDIRQDGIFQNGKVRIFQTADEDGVVLFELGLELRGDVICTDITSELLRTMQKEGGIGTCG